MSDTAKHDRKEERPSVLRPSPRAGGGRRPGWIGPTYYGRPQLKSAPFENPVVGSYIFLAGLSGSASLIGWIADLAGGRAGRRLARRANLLALLAPTLGAGLLIKDLHTPQRFYNMLRLAKPRSPMSLGTWTLMGFSLGAFPAAIGGLLADHVPGFRRLGPAARAAQTPAALAGAGLSVYTAPLLSATSTPAWAASPRALAVRFGASSIASAAAALLLGERDPKARKALELLAAGALGVEAAATAAQASDYRRTGVEQATQGAWGKAEKLLATGLGVIAPLALFAAGAALGGRRGQALAEAGAVSALAGSAMLRISTLGVGDESALRPEISLRFAQPENLPLSPSSSSPGLTGRSTPRGRGAAEGSSPPLGSPGPAG